LSPGKGFLVCLLEVIGSCGKVELLHVFDKQVQAFLATFWLPEERTETILIVPALLEDDAILPEVVLELVNQVPAAALDVLGTA
jgi:hypothetical protein